MIDENFTPKKREEWVSTFLGALRHKPNITAAARQAGISRQAAYLRRDSDNIFAAAWDEALKEGIETLEAEALRRAFEGVEEPVHYKGKRVDTVKKYSDTLAIFLLKAHAPEKYRENIDITSGGQPIQIAIVNVDTDAL